MKKNYIDYVIILELKKYKKKIERKKQNKKEKKRKKDDRICDPHINIV